MRPTFQESVVKAVGNDEAANTNRKFTICRQMFDKSVNVFGIRQLFKRKETCFSKIGRFESMQRLRICDIFIVSRSQTSKCFLFRPVVEFVVVSEPLFDFFIGCFAYFQGNEPSTLSAGITGMRRQVIAAATAGISALSWALLARRRLESSLTRRRRRRLCVDSTI